MRHSSFFILFIFPWLCFVSFRSLAQSKPIVFIRATVIDMTGAKPEPDMTVIIVGNRISTIGKTGKVVCRRMLR